MHCPYHIVNTSSSGQSKGSTQNGSQLLQNWYFSPVTEIPSDLLKSIKDLPNNFSVSATFIIRKSPLVEDLALYKGILKP